MKIIKECLLKEEKGGDRMPKYKKWKGKES